MGQGMTLRKTVHSLNCLYYLVIQRTNQYLQCTQIGKMRRISVNQSVDRKSGVMSAQSKTVSTTVIT